MASADSAGPQGLGPGFPQAPGRDLPAGLAEQIGRISGIFKDGLPGDETWSEALQTLGRVERGPGSASEAKFLYRSIGRWVSSLLSRPAFVDGDAEQNAALREQASVFLRAVLKLSVERIGLRSNRLADACDRIMSPRFPFYSGVALAKGEERPPAPLLSKQQERDKLALLAALHAAVHAPLGGAAVQARYVRCAALSKQHLADLDPLYVVHVNYFFQIGGLDAATELLQQREPVALPFVRAHVGAVHSPLPYLHDEFAHAFAPAFCEAIFEHLLWQSRDNFSPDEKDNFTVVATFAQNFMRVTQPGDVVNRVHTFNLDVHLKGFGADNLERNLRGVRSIKKLIDDARKGREEKRLVNRFMATITRGGEEDGAAAAARIDMKLLYDWLCENQVLEKLFQPNQHPEMVRQGVDIPVFMAEMGYLQQSHIDMLWATAVGKHEAVRNVIYSAYNQLLDFLNPTDLEHLYQLIGQIPLDTIDTEDVGFIFSFSSKAIIRTNGSQPFGLEILWRLMQAETKVTNPRIHQDAYNRLLDLFRLPAYSSQRQSYAEQSVQKWAASQSVEHCLRLLTALVDLRARPRDKRKMIEQLDQRHNLLVIFLRDLAAFLKSYGKQKSAAARAAMTAGFRTRLTFVHYLVTVGELKFDAAQTATLWKLLSRSRAAELLPVSLEYLDALDSAFTPEALQQLFQSLQDSMERLQHLAVRSATDQPIAFNVYRKYFYLVNQQAQTIRVTPSGARYAAADELIGADPLWHLLAASDDRVLQDLAIHTLNGLYQNVSAESLKPRLGAIRSAFLQRCMAQLAAADDAALLNALRQLRTFVDGFAAAPTGDSASSSSSSSNGGVLTTLNLMVEVRPSGPNLELTMNSTDTLNDLKAEIAYRCGQHVDLVRVALPGSREAVSDEECKKQLSETNLIEAPQLLADFRALENADKMDSRLDDMSLPSLVMEVVHFLLKATSTMGVEPKRLRARRFSRHFDFDKDTTLPGLEDQAKTKRVTAQYHPARLLAVDGYFGRLYQLLDHANVNVAKAVWELLDILPNDPDMDRSLKTSPDFANLFSGDNVFKLAYTLQLVLHLVLEGQAETTTTTTTTDDHKWSFDAWSANFVRQGGIVHLCTALMQLAVPEQCSPGPVTAAGILLQLINHFTTEASVAKNLRGRREEIYSLRDCFPADVAPDQLTERLLRLARLVSSAPAGMAAAGSMARNAFRLLRAVLRRHPNLLISHFWQLADERGWLMALLLEAPNQAVRSEAAHCLSAIATEFHENDPLVAQGADSIGQSLSTRLLRFLPDIASHSQTCGQYFALLEALLSDLSPSKSERRHVPDKWRELTTMLVQQLRTHPVCEVGLSCTVSLRAVDEDKVLIGILNLLRTLFNKFPRLKEADAHLIDVLFDDCLLAMPSKDSHDAALAPPKCKTPAARESAYRLLVELARRSPPNFAAIFARLLAQMADTRKLPGAASWTNRADAPRSPTGYCGLQNQGATCYMNSLMQQIFSVMPFRQGVLSVVDTYPDKHESLLFHIQHMFTWLSESLFQYYDTTAFCRTIKDEDGRPVNPRIQMDANEFFNRLFDRLEGLLSATPQRELLHSVFGGQLAHQLLPRGCSHGSERDEPFYALSIDVKNKKSLHEALEFFVEGETLSGDNAWLCEECGERRDTVKRCGVKNLPPVLFVHLKRFDFDYMEMRHLKINDRIEFPFEINMEPYTREGLLRKDGDSETDPLRASGALKVSYDKPDEYYQYYLTGIVVHSGSANSGHYYSFIKPLKPGQSPDEPGPWFEFNDTRVSPFDLARVERECFGGPETYNFYDRETGRTIEKTRMRMHSAYMLLYQRKQLPEPDLHAAAVATASPVDALSDQHRTPEPCLAPVFSSDDPVAKVDDVEQAAAEPVDGERSALVTATRMGIERNDDEAPSSSSSSSPPSSTERSRKSRKSKRKTATADSPPAAAGEQSASPEVLPPPPDGSSGQSPPVVPDKVAVVHVSPEDMRVACWAENRNYIHRAHIYSSEYFQFVWSFLGLTHGNAAAYDSGEFDAFMKVTEFTTNFFFDVFSHAEVRVNFDRWCQFLYATFTASKPAAQWFVRNFCTRSREFARLFTECPSPRVRETFAHIVDGILRSLAPDEREHYAAEHRTLSAQQPITDRFNRKHTPVSYVMWFMDTFINVMKTNKSLRAASASAEYFLVLKNFAAMGRVELEWMLSENLLVTLVDFYLEQGAFLPSFYPSSSSSSSSSSSPASSAAAPRALFDAALPSYGPMSQHLGHLVELVDVLLRHCLPLTGDQTPPPTLLRLDDGGSGSFELSEAALQRLVGPGAALYWERAASSASASARGAVGQSMVHLCWENKARSQFFINTLRTGMQRNNIWYFLPVIATLQDVKDRHQLWRIDATMIKAASVVKDRATTNDHRKHLRRWLDDRAAENPGVKAWMITNDKWVVADLQDALTEVEPPAQHQFSQGAASSSRTNLGARLVSVVSGNRR